MKRLAMVLAVVAMGACQKAEQKPAAAAAVVGIVPPEKRDGGAAEPAGGEQPGHARGERGGNRERPVRAAQGRRAGGEELPLRQGGGRVAGDVVRAESPLPCGQRRERG